MFKISATRSLASSNQLPVFRKQTQISSIYTQLSSIKPASNGLPRPVKTVRTTEIGNVALPPKTSATNNNHITIVNHRSTPELRNIRSTTSSTVNNNNVNQAGNKIQTGTSLTNGYKI